MRLTKIELLKETIRWQVARLLRAGYTKQRIIRVVNILLAEVLA